MFPSLRLEKAVLLCALILIISASVISPLRKKVKAQQPTPQSCPTCSHDEERLIYAPTFDVPDANGADIVLNCRSPHEMDVVPTFYTEDGQAVMGSSIHLQAAEIRFATVESLIPPEHQNEHHWGGISFSYTGKLMEF